MTANPETYAANPAFLDNLVADWPGADQAPTAAKLVAGAFENAAHAVPPLRPTIANLIAQAHALGGLNKTATVGLLIELANDIRAGEARPNSKVAHHASRLHDATAPEALPVFMRSRRGRP